MNSGGEGLEMEFTIRGMDFRAAGEGASRIKHTLKQIGFSPEAVRRAAIAAYEAEMNMVIHSYGGVLRARFYPSRVELEACDRGPGIADIEQAMREGYSTAPPAVREMGFGAGMGLPNIKKCSDFLEIQSEVGRGTMVRIVIQDKKTGQLLDPGR
ncbi:anti-sigma regulatory factor [Clostridiales bacterium PH28_bin88]|nr:anti-sigma regulatory factor [Clostridiales bacterium PH28_bin88]